MPDGCLFCDPSQSRILCESENWYVRYDNYPATDGHVELVPRRHIESLIDLALGEEAEVFPLLRRALNRLAVEHDFRGWNVGVNDGPAAGQSIPHLHIHVIPRYVGDQDDPRGGIRRGLPNGDPGGWTAALERTSDA